MSVLESWEGVRGWVMPERGRVEFWVWQGKECYKLEIMFQDILEANGYFLGDGKQNALILKVCLMTNIIITILLLLCGLWLTC